VEDFKRRVLRAVAADTFVEDSLRVLRAVQLTARFEMTVEPSTAELCRGIDLSDLPSERVWGEIEKLLLLAERPSIGLQTALELEVINKLFPELKGLGNGPDDASFAHTALSLDQAAKLTRDLSKPERIAVMLATICHDLGKPAQAKLSDTELTDHAALSVEPARSILKKLGLHSLDGYDARSQTLSLVREHLRPTQFYESREKVSDGAFRRLSQTVDLNLLYRVVKACALARGVASPIAEDWFIERARKLGVEDGPPAPVLLGRHLIEDGLAPGPEMGRVLREVYQLQLDGEVTTLEEALVSARNLR
jgi:tRNA nucleotidyltransferase (CCA-adding enzyme)